ncbi:MAG: hypothetical protein KF703_18065, partial [Actinobacteria bacterium]|nr:hypothetical protein [Actinomycetota bacterium]
DLGEVSLDVLGLPVGRTQIYNSVIKQGGRSDQATCYADGIVDAFTFEQFSGSFPGTPEGRRMLEDARDACF